VIESFSQSLTSTSLHCICMIKQAPRLRSACAARRDSMALTAVRFAGVIAPAQPAMVLEGKASAQAAAVARA